MSRVVVGADGGNSKTELVVASLDGEPLAYVRGRGSNSHSVGAEGTAVVLDRLAARAEIAEPADVGVFFLCGADLPADIEELRDALARRAWVRDARVDNDTFALLRAGTDASDAVAVICGSGINCVGRAADGRTARYPSLGWETGDWGGGDMLGREALFRAARAEDGRGEPTALGELIRRHFGAASVGEVGEAVHYRRMRGDRLAELAPAVLALATDGDAVARTLLDRLADEVVLMALRALRDLELDFAEVVLGGGLFRERPLVEEVTRRLAQRAPGARPVVAVDPPVLGAALAALDAAHAGPDAAPRLRAAFRGGLEPEDVRGG